MVIKSFRGIADDENVNEIWISKLQVTEIQSCMEFMQNTPVYCCYNINDEHYVQSDFKNTKSCFHFFKCQ